MVEVVIGNKYRHTIRGQVGTAVATSKDTFMVPLNESNPHFNKVPMELKTVQLRLDDEFLSFPHDGHHQNRWFRFDWLTPMDATEAAQWEAERKALADAKQPPEALGAVPQATPAPVAVP